MAEPDDVLQRWVKVLDQNRCIGCHACTTACKSENEVPLGVTRTYVKSVDVGTFPQVRRAFQVTRCNQCADAPCVAACPTEAMYKRPDGIVDFDKAICIGCKACMAACPYDAIFINPEDHSAEKCNFCAHRLDVGLEPACVSVCPTEAILVGDLNDPASRVAADRPARAGHGPPAGEGDQARAVLPGRPPGDARPAGRPAAGRRPVRLGDPGRRADPDHVRRPGIPGRPNSSAEALLSYDVPHHAPWGWRVSLYTWTKSIAAGACSSRCCSSWPAGCPGDAPLARWAAPGRGAGLPRRHRDPADLGPEAPAPLLPDLHPAPLAQLAGRGSFIIGGYGGAVALYLLGSLTGSVVLRQSLAASRSRWRWPPPATPPTCSPRPRRGTSGRARCCRRTWPSRRRWPARP